MQLHFHDSPKQVTWLWSWSPHVAHLVPLAWVQAISLGFKPPLYAQKPLPLGACLGYASAGGCQA